MQLSLAPSNPENKKCDLLLMRFFDEKNAFKATKVFPRNTYVIAGSKLFYLDKANNKSQQIAIKEEMNRLMERLSISPLSPEEETRLIPDLSDAHLRTINSVTEHTHGQLCPYKIALLHGLCQRI